MEKQNAPNQPEKKKRTQLSWKRCDKIVYILSTLSKLNTEILFKFLYLPV